MVERLDLFPSVGLEGGCCYRMLIVLFVLYVIFVLYVLLVFFVVVLLMSVHVILPLNVCMLPCYFVSPWPLPINVSMFS